MLVNGLGAQSTPSASPQVSPLPTTSASDVSDRDREKSRRPSFKSWVMHDRLEKMTPEQRKEAVQKVRRWLDMPNDEQAHRRFMQNEREKRTREAVAAAIQASGLQLDETQKERFASIYRIERRKLEEVLRTEMEQKRKEQLPVLEKSVAELYKSELAAPAVSPTP